jgi:ferric-dicitrate binding protein FerR (iron transport regulator)
VDEVLAWKEGEFWFNETDIATVMRQIERWYDVEIVYEGARPDTRISGVIPRKSEVSDLLAVLEGTGKVHCRQEGNRIIVTKPKS